jgi:bacillithiol biosynthesis deacetylase BshB1
MTDALDALAVGAHPDDVELGCGGTVALLAAQGHRVGILHLTSGEAGTRGSARRRRAEAGVAAAALGCAELVFLDCGDGALRTGMAEEEALVAELRRLRPRLVLGPTPRDRHPDHGRAHALVEAACFYAGLSSRGLASHGTGSYGPGAGPPPHRPAAVFSYMQHDPFEPAFIVDVTAAWEAKNRALDAYASQLYRPSATAPSEGDGERSDDGGDGDPGEPVTKVSTRDFRLAVEGRARHFGGIIGATFGEPFWARVPPAVRDPMQLLPGGVL